MKSGATATSTRRPLCPTATRRPQRPRPARHHRPDEFRLLTSRVADGQRVAAGDCRRPAAVRRWWRTMSLRAPRREPADLCERFGGRLRPAARAVGESLPPTATLNPDGVAPSPRSLPTPATRPPAVVAWKDATAAADAVVVVTPSTTTDHRGPFKNAIDCSLAARSRCATSPLVSSAPPASAAATAPSPLPPDLVFTNSPATMRPRSSSRAPRIASDAAGVLRRPGTRELPGRFGVAQLVSGSNASARPPPPLIA
jgi:hypothetical protein